MTEKTVTKLVKDHDFKVDPGFLALFPRASQDIDDSLDSRITEEHGNTNPVTVWAERSILVDGHRRRASCERTGQPLTARYRSFKSKYEAMTFASREHESMRPMRQHDETMSHGQIIQALLDDGFGKSEAMELAAIDLGKSARTLWRQYDAWESYHRLSIDWQTAIADGTAEIRQEHYRILAELSGVQQDEMLARVLSTGYASAAIPRIDSLAKRTVEVRKSQSSGRVTLKTVRAKTEKAEDESPEDDGMLEPDSPYSNPFAWDDDDESSETADEYLDVSDDEMFTPVAVVSRRDRDDEKQRRIAEEASLVSGKEVRPPKPVVIDRKVGDRKEILSRCLSTEKACGAVARAFDHLFGEGGLDAPESAWRTKALNLVRELGMVVRSIRQSNETLEDIKGDE